MKLRTLGDLNDAIDRETAWRKRELTTTLFQVQGARKGVQPLALRSGIAILYAHWEGWVKRVTDHYVDFVHQQKLSYAQLSDHFMAMSLKTEIRNLAESRSPKLHLDFVELIRNGQAGRARVVAVDSIRTESNLSSASFHKIVTALALDYRPYVEFEKLIDERLVRVRNHVAHGEFIDVDPDGFETLHKTTTNMLYTFTNAVVNQAATGGYRL